MEDEVWVVSDYRDDLSTMDDYEEQLENDGINDYEEGLIRGFQASA